jgi:valine dehydrogenase (NAD+)
MIFDRAPQHEQVVFGNDPDSGLRAIVAIYSTALGPALGGTRFYPFADEEAALVDVLNLSKAMAYKNALAGLAHGGGKAVIIGDPATDKSPALLRAYGRLVQSLSGRYVTACDVGTYVADMDVVAETCAFVTGRSESAGGAGDSSVLTAFGVYRGMLAAARDRWNADNLAGRRIGIVGVGKVGRHLIELATDDHAHLVVADVSEDARSWVLANFPAVTILADADEVSAADLDILSPCALGGAITDANVDTIAAAVICGAANNQLAHDGLDHRLMERGILYCPDYVVNSGGVIQVSDELHGFDFARAKAKTARIYDTTLEVIDAARRNGVTPTEAADRLAEERMSASPRPRFAT